MEHLRDKIFSLIRHSIPICGVELELLLDDVAEDFFVVVTFEWWVTAEEDKEDDAK